MRALPLLLALTLPSMLSAGQQPAPKATLAPPSAEQRKARAAVVHADYRFDDLLWENDRTAHRIYGRALEANEPPSSSGLDAWGKSVRYPFADRQLRTGDQHANHGEGIDFYDVHTSRGAGGLGVWQDNKLWVSRNYARYEILRNGPDTAAFRVGYDAWPVGVDRKVWETRSFTLPAGTNFTRQVSTIRSDKPDPLVIGIGISKRGVAEKMGQLTTDKATGRMSWWSAEAPGDGHMGIAVMVDPDSVVGYVQDYDNYLVLVRVRPGVPFVFYTGAAWDHGLDFHDRAGWDAYVAAQKPDFDASHDGA